MLNQVEELIWTLVMTVLVCVLITNASCFTSGFCCCCSGARQHRRRRIEDEQTQFVQLVAQNDHEYSVLLMDIADMVLDPNLVFATCLVQCLRLENGSRSVFSGNLEGLCLRSLIPVLESEHQATRFVFRLMVIEFEETFGIRKKLLISNAYILLNRHARARH
uniref:Uncharacterized protein n=1 Tax=Globisporangium ultimum (strain ATCC 200006 / CBS 805.95 / DAOM BR144) TaxID=431595 RepID=K3WA81_GLOUD